MHAPKHAAIICCALWLVGAARANDLPKAPLPVVYTINARLDVQQKTLAGTEILRYRNLTGRPQARFPFHLYLNAFQPAASFMQETRRDNPQFAWDNKWYGAAEVKSVIVAGVGDLTSQIRFLHPDDDNASDRTVFEINLPQAIPPGGEVEFRIAFHDRFPEIFARSGHRRDFFMGAQWFPKIGVWWKDAWNCHQYHRDTEFFSDFGTYDVTLTVPQGYVVGASGTESGSVNNPDGSRTVHYQGDAIHDFAWAASPKFRVITDRFTGSAGPIDIRLLMSPGHLGLAQRYLAALKGAMQRLDQWYGPYPYPQITVIDTPQGAGGAGDMEYPTLITASTSWWIPPGLRLPELVIAHEFGHQYWYGMVATNEFEDPWLDEGINSYVEAKVMNSLYGASTSVVNFAGATLGEAGWQRMDYLALPDTDPLVRPGWLFMNSAAYERVSYGKTATVLLTLEKLIGEETLQRALRTYFLRYRFAHPTRDDFLSTVQEVAGQDLSWYFNQAVYGTALLDYEILSVNSDRNDWAQETTARPPAAGLSSYRSIVLVHRKGDFIFPVDVVVKFSDGETVREHWDGQDRWKRYTYDRAAQVDSAELDSQPPIWLDQNTFNNSRTREANSAATLKLANYWMVLTQLFAQLVAWLV
jgi:hypothetical protein